MPLQDMIDHMDSTGIDADPDRDITRFFPGITQDQALMVQLGVKRRYAAAGNAIVGHQASFTTPAARALFPDGPKPMVGTLLSSHLQSDGDEVILEDGEYLIECEIGLVLQKDLEGPDLTPMKVLEAVDYFVPAIEVAPLRTGMLEGAYSYEHMIAAQKAFGGYIVTGSRHTARHGIDLSLEGCVASVDGQPMAGAVGFDAMGSPLNVVAAVAATLHSVGERLHEGQLVITGSLPAPPRVQHGRNLSARADFTRLGSVSVRFS